VSQLVAAESVESIVGVWLVVNDRFSLLLHDFLRVVPIDDADLPEIIFCDARLLRLFRDGCCSVDESKIDEVWPRGWPKPGENIGLKMGGVSGKV
jgi:hypothetical protein